MNYSYRKLILEALKRLKGMEEECQDCGRKTTLQLHHKIPLREGGHNSLDNLTILCRKCHTRQHREERKKIRKINDKCRICGNLFTEKEKEFYRIKVTHDLICSKCNAKRQKDYRKKLQRKNSNQHKKKKRTGDAKIWLLGQKLARR